MKLNTVISCVPFFANWIFSVIFRQETGRIKVFLKGQSHEKVGEMRVQGDSLGPN
jgi:hypothetical protein